MLRRSMLVGLGILGLALLVGTSESQEKKDKKGYLPPGFKALALTPTQDETLRQINTDYKLKIDEATKKLNDLSEPVEVRDEAGAFFGVFLPKDIYRELLRNVRVPFTEAQLEEFRKSGDGRPLSDLWKELGVA